MNDAELLAQPDGDVEAPPELWPSWTDEHWESGDDLPLTARQAQILGLIAESLHRRGLPPTIRELGIATGILGPNGVVCHLRALLKKGWITRDKQISRGIRLVRGQVRRAERGVTP